MKGIADTGFIVAFGNRNDFHHAWALDVAKRISEPLLTCEAVLAEAAFHLGSSGYVLDLVRNKMLRVAFDCSRNLEPLADLARRYLNRGPDFADLCVIRMSELYPRSSSSPLMKATSAFTGGTSARSSLCCALPAAESSSTSEECASYRFLRPGA